jgi:hypothetical protein
MLCPKLTGEHLAFLALLSFPEAQSIRRMAGRKLRDWHILTVLDVLYLRLGALKVAHQRIGLKVPLNTSKVVIMHVALVSLLYSPPDNEEHTTHMVGTHFCDIF